MLVFLVFLLAYLIGSIPSAIWLGKYCHGIDVRQHGSGNSGATNAFRVLGKRTGLIVLCLDVLKGFLATKLVLLLGISLSGPENAQSYTNYQLALGLVAVFGHLFPVFARFNGGKGVATLFGMMLSIHLPAALLCTLVFFVVLFLFRYVSLSSMLAGITFPLSVIFIFQSSITSMILYGICFSILIFVTHQKNIERLLRGQERKIDLKLKNS